MANEIHILTAFKGHSPEVREMIVDTVIERARILNWLPIIPLNKGFTLEELENVTGQTGNPAFRGLNEDYTNSYHEMRPRTYGVKQLGDALRIEKKVERQLPGTAARQLRLKLKGIGMFVTKNFFNGDSETNPKSFDGLKTILGTSGSQVLNTSADLTINTDASTIKDFFDLLDDAFRAIAGTPSAILMSDALKDAVTSGARHLGADVLGSAKDFSGEQIEAYRGVPLIPIGNDEAGSAILPFTESVGGGTNGGSLYVVKFDEDDGVAGISTSGIQILPDEDNLFIRDVIDFDLGLIARTNSAVRVCRLKKAS